MAQHLLGFSWMASDCISCPVIRSPFSHKHPALSENLQHTAAYRAIEMTSSSNVLRLYPCSPGPGLDLPCPPLAVPLLLCYSYKKDSQFIQHVSRLESGSAFVLAGQLKRSLWSH
eukprot:superscaffoldBa00001961_g12669